jgi:cell division protein FtsQ
MFGSINNINLRNIEINKIKSINVDGFENKENRIITEKIADLKLDNIFFLDGEKIKKVLETNPLIEKYNVFKNYPSSIKIYIVKTKFLAKINVDGTIFLIGSNGKLSKNFLKENDLPFIFGKPDIDDFLNFKKIFEKSKFEYNQIKHLFFFPSKRWDIEFKNNKILRLSEIFDEFTLNYLFEFMNDKNNKDIKIIDARIKNQIILDE